MGVPDYRLEGSFSDVVLKLDLTGLLNKYGAVKIHHFESETRIRRIKKLLEHDFEIEMDIISKKFVIIRGSRWVGRAPDYGPTNLSSPTIRVFRRCEGVKTAEKYLYLSDLRFSPEDIEEKINRIQNFLNQGKKIPSQTRNELIGAIGELKTLSALVLLPSTYVIFNNINLESDNYLRYRKPDGSGYGYLGRQQIDHVVVGPPGVFVIESKLWGCKTVIQPKEYTPFEQILRCKRVLGKYLKQELGRSSIIRQIVVQTGRTKFSGRKRIVVLQPKHLVDHIQSYQHRLEPRQIENIVDIFRRTN